MSGVQLSLRSENGSALLNAIVVCVLLGIVTFIITQINSAAIERQRVGAARIEMTTLIDAVRTQLQNPDTCPGLIQNAVINPVAGAETPISIATGYGSQPGPIITGWIPRPGGRPLLRVFLRTIVPALSTIRLDKPGPTLTKHWVRIYLVPAEILWNVVDLPDPASTIIGATKPKFSEYAIELHVKTDPATNQIKQCHGPFSIANGCEMKGGGYDASQLPERRCMPDSACYLSPVGLVNSAALCTNPFTRADRMGGPPGPDLYLCQWCWDGIQN